MTDDYDSFDDEIEFVELKKEESLPPTPSPVDGSLPPTPSPLQELPPTPPPPPSHDSFDDDVEFEEKREDDLELGDTPPPQEREDSPENGQKEDEEDQFAEKILPHPASSLSPVSMGSPFLSSFTSWPESPPPSVLGRLRTFFGHSSFRPHQWEIIRGVLTGRDQLAIMATGYGKSVCYQMPSILRGDVTIVVSPLLSLIEDQLTAINVTSERAAAINGNTTPRERENIVAKIMNGSLLFLYLTPEFVEADSTILPQIKSRVSVVAIDEAHCVSQWGHDFRSSYRHLARLRRLLHPVTVLAVTATATPEVASDIKDSLQLVNCNEIRTELDRKNIFLSVRRSSGLVENDLIPMLKEDPRLGRHFGGPAIVYCQAKKRVKEVHDSLRSAGVRVAMYHAGLSDTTRKKAHHDFITDKVTVIVATIAFGMGIDKADVRLIVHYGAPKNVESFYQEIGRAGRDGDSAKSIVFYEPKQISTNRALVTSSMQNEAFKRHAIAMMTHMEEYLTVLSCRRRSILGHFSTSSIAPSPPKASCCDNCDRLMDSASEDRQMEVEVATEGRLFLRTLSTVYSWGSGAGKVVDYLRGSAKEKAKSTATHMSAEGKGLYGAGKHRSEAWWKDFAHQLRIKSFIQEEQIPNNKWITIMKVSPAGLQWMKSSQSLTVPATPVLLKASSTSKAEKGTTAPVRVCLPSGPSERRVLLSVRKEKWQPASSLCSPSETLPSLSIVEARAQLKETLLEVRNSLAGERDIGPFHVASNKVVEQLADLVPNDLSALSSISDWGEDKIRLFGSRFVDACKQFASDRGLETNNVARRLTLPPSLQSSLDSLPPAVISTYRCHLESASTAEDLSNVRSLSLSTVWNHLATAALHGLPLHLEALALTPKHFTIIERNIRMMLGGDISRLKPVMETLPAEFIDYNRMKTIMRILEYEYGTEETDEAVEKPSTAAAPAWMASLSRSASVGEPSAKKKRVAL